MTPVQMMISSRSGLIRWTVLRETISREALPRPLFDDPLRRGMRISAVGFRLEPLNHVTVVIEARAEQMCEENSACCGEAIVAICIVPSPVGLWLRTAARRSLECPSAGRFNLNRTGFAGGSNS